MILYPLFKSLFIINNMRNRLSLKDINNILKNIPSDSFEDKRALICILLLSTTKCNVYDLRKFNLHVISKLIRDGKVIIQDNDSIYKFRINKTGQRLLSKNFNIIYGYYENENLKVSDHVLMSVKGNPITNKSLFVWLYRHLNKVKHEPSVKTIFKLF